MPWASLRGNGRSGLGALLMGRFLRRAVALATLCAMPMGAGAEDALLPEPACPGVFPAPEVPMMLSRQLRRNLFDGKEIVVTRHYRVIFAPTADGFRVDGAQIDTEVEAPPRLAALADIEKARADTTTFPIYLDRTGLIVSAPDPMHHGSASRVQSVAQQMIAAANLKAQTKGQASDFVHRLFSQQGPVVTQWPEALFRPGGGPRITRNAITLGGGESGVVTMTLRPVSARPCALMQSMERIVETEVGQEKRRTTERWTLTPMAAGRGVSAEN